MFYLIANNLKAVTATGFKPGIAVLQSLNHTCCEFHTPPTSTSTSGLGVAIARVTCGQK